MDAIRENHTFHRIQRTEDVDAKGSVKKTTTQEREVFFVNGRQIGRLVKRNGAELSASEAKSEQARVTRMVEMAMTAPPQHGPTGLIGMVGDILSVAAISKPRRVSLNGRATLAFDLTGDPDAHLAGLGGYREDAAKKTAGVVWFDEAERQLARLEVRLNSNFRVGGGLLSIRKGTR